MALVRISGPAIEPVSLDEMKAHLNVDYDDDDALIQSYISASRQKIEQRCARAFVLQTWELRTAEFEDCIEIPKPPTVEVISVKYLDEDHVEQIVDPTKYALIDGGEASTSEIIRLGEWPTDLADRPDAVRIRFTAGWAPDGVVDPDTDPDDYVANVPFVIKQAIMYTVGSMHELRESVLLAPTRQELVVTPDSVDAIIAPYILPRL